MFTAHPIGFIISPYKETHEIPKGPGAKHEAEGILKVLPEFQAGLTDIEGFSHLIVLWEFDRRKGSSCSPHRPSTRGRTEYLRPDRPAGRILLA